jgi:multidrug efflux system membrane fusion protein
MTRALRGHEMIVVFAWCAAACSGASGKAPSSGGAPSGGPGAGPPGAGDAIRFPVEVAPVESRRVEYALTAVGSVEAYERVQVTARVAGVVERVLFREGDTAKEGQTLVEIEPRRYRVAVTAARAALERTAAAKSDAEAALARRETAVAQSPGLIPAEEIESTRTRQRVALAEAAQAQAAIDEAELNLRDAYVRAPIAGTLETRSVETGQYVQPGTVLAFLVRRDPLLVRFQVPEGESAGLRTGMKATFRVRNEAAPRTATITHVAQTADTGSRMVPVVAEVDANQREGLRPGAFAEVSVPIGNTDNAPVIPAIAIRPSEKGFLAFVVAGEVAHERVVTLGMRTADGLVEIRSGLRPGESLVVRGGEALREGAKVRAVGSK